MRNLWLDECGKEALLEDEIPAVGHQISILVKGLGKGYSLAWQSLGVCKGLLGKGCSPAWVKGVLGRGWLHIMLG